MSNNATAGSARPELRRPPAPVSSLASVTRLTPDPGRRPTVPVAATQGTLALDLRGSLGMPVTPELRVVDPTAGSHDVHGWAGTFAQAVVEVLGGDRPLTQLLRWTTKGVYHDLDSRVRILRRTTTTGQRVRTVRPQVRSVHVFQPGPGTAEVSVHVRHGQRSRAIAARLEMRQGRWRCTELQLG